MNCKRCGVELQTICLGPCSILDTHLTKEEIKILYNHLSHEFISYENVAIIELMKKITRIANDELDHEGS
jgi:hypothetical protein